MTDSIRIDTGVKRILINDGPDYIEFNPSSVLFADKFYAIYQDFEAKRGEYQIRAEEIDRESDVDENGLPLNIQARIAFLKAVCEYMRGKIDQLFGADTSDKVFGDALNLDMFGQFLEQITPFIQKARSQKTVKYTPKQGNNKVMK